MVGWVEVWIADLRLGRGRGIGAIADLRFGACDVRNDAGEGVHS